MRTLPLVLGLSLLLGSAASFAAEPPPAAPPTPPAATPAPPGAPPAAAAPAPPSPEALADASHQVDLGRQALKTKRYALAAHSFETAAALGRQPSAHHAAGLAWELAERPERAADAFARALAGGGEGLSPQEAAVAKDHLDTLERALGTLDVKAPAGWSLQLDGSVEAPAPAKLHGAPGVHTLAVVAPDRPIARRDVRIELGKTTALALKDEPLVRVVTEPGKPEGVPAAPSSASPAAPPRIVTVEAPASGQVRRAVGFTALGLGVASLGAALVLGLETIDARNAFNASPSRPLYDHEQTLQTWTNVTLIAGAVLAVGGVVLVVWPSGSSDARVGLAPAPGGGALVGTF